MRKSPPSLVAMLTLSRRSSALVAVFCLLGLLSVQLHYLLVRHTACAEHGDLIHEGGAKPRRAPAFLDTLRLQVSSLVAGADTVAHEHDHCGVVSPRCSCERSEVRGAALTLAPLARPAREARRPHAIEILLLAPKTSPPV